MNPLLNQFGNTNNSDFWSEFNKFRSSFKGDPKAKVQELLNSGQMTQEQFNQLSQQATQIMRMFK